MKKTTLALGFLTAVSAFAQSEIKTTVGGDMRFRHEALEVENNTGKDNYDHLRLRARLAIKSQINETLSTELRVATGTGGTATNQTYSGTQNYDFKLDRAYAKYAPNENTVVRLGRTESPYVAVGDNNMLFDGDLNFDGASVGYMHKTDSMSAQLILAHSVLTEGGPAAPVIDKKLNSAELALRFGGEANSFLVTAAQHSFSNLKGLTAIVGASNNSVTGGNYLYNYDVTSVGLEYAYKGGSVPMTFFAEMANNNRTSENDTATIYGVKFNKLKKKGDWMVSVDSREVEKDSTVGSLVDGDSFGGGTNGKSLNTTLAYNLEDNANLMVTYLAGELGIAQGETGVDRNRMQVDINVKF